MALTILFDLDGHDGPRVGITRSACALKFDLQADPEDLVPYRAALHESFRNFSFDRARQAGLLPNITASAAFMRIRSIGIAMLKRLREQGGTWPWPPKPTFFADRVETF